MSAPRTERAIAAAMASVSLVIVMMATLYFARGAVARPLLVIADGVDYAIRGPEGSWHPATILMPDGTMSYWWQDDYTAPSVRCFSRVMNITRCYSAQEELPESPCEARAHRVCRWIYPLNGK